MCMKGKRIFSNVLGKMFIENLPQHLKFSGREEKRGKGEVKRRRGKEKNEERDTFLRLKYFKMLI